MGERNVGGVTAIAADHHIRRWLNSLCRRSRKERVARNSFPARAELRPLGNAVDVGGNLFAREPLKLVPRPTRCLAGNTCQCEIPFLQRTAWRRPRRQNGEIAGLVLTRR